MPRNPSVRLSRSSSGLGAGSKEKDDVEVSGWIAGGMIMGAVVGWASYAPHVVLAHRRLYAASSISLPFLPLARQLNLGAQQAEAKLIEARARRLHQPLNLLHPGVWASTAETWANGLVCVACQVCYTLLSINLDESLWKRAAGSVVSGLLSSLASFPFFVAQARLFAQLAGDTTTLPLTYTGLGQTLRSINYADAFRYAFVPYFLLALTSEVFITWYSSREEVVVDWLCRKLPPFKTRNKTVKKTKRLIAEGASNMLNTLATYLIASPLHVLGTTMAIQGSGLEAALGVPRYTSSLQCAEDIFVRHGPLAFYQDMVPRLYGDVVPQMMATTFTAFVFNALAYLREE